MTGFAIKGDMALNADETDCVFVEGLVAVQQQIEAGAQVFAETWHFDRNVGLDIEDIFVKDADLRLVRLAVYDFLAAVPGVGSVVSANLRVVNDTRSLFVEFEVRTDFGPLQNTLALQFPGS